ncbi:MAG: glycosyltransferase family 2 protein [Balneolia bacterium]|nr:glycosyltransferase family 2 protein [Balneolia bacterium]
MIKELIPSIAVVIPLYNKQPHISECLHSVFAQKIPPDEIIVVNDMSTDGSREEVVSINHPKVRIIDRNEPGPGGYAARNAGVEASDSDFVAFLDADDIWEEDYLYSMISLINKFPDASFYASGWIEDNGYQKHVNAHTATYGKQGAHQIDSKEYMKLAISGCNPVWTCATVVKKSVLMGAGGFPEGRCRYGGDIDTWLRIMLSGNKLAINPVPKVVYKMDSVNMVTRQNALNIIESCMRKTMMEMKEELSDKPELAELLRTFVSYFQMLPVRRRAMAGLLQPGDLRYVDAKALPGKYFTFYLFSLLPSKIQKWIAQTYTASK